MVSRIRRSLPRFAVMSVVLSAMLAACGGPDTVENAPPTGSSTPPGGDSTPPPAQSPSPTSTGTARMSWTAPLSNTDGSTLSNLSGFRIYYGTSESALDRTIDVSNPSISTYTIENLSSGVWYFGVKAYTSSGEESTLSNVASKTIG